MTTALALKAALYAGLQGLAGLAGARVVYGRKTGEPSHDQVALGDVSRWIREDAAIGPSRPRNETYAVAVQITARKGATNLQAAEAQAFDYFQAVEVYLDGDPEVGGTVWDATVSDLEMTGNIDSRDSIATLTAQITARARI